MPIWGVWVKGRFYFSTGKKSVKARNLAKNPNCVLCPGGADEAVMLEGRVSKIRDKKTLKEFARRVRQEIQIRSFDDERTHFRHPAKGGFWADRKDIPEDRNTLEFLTETESLVRTSND